VKTIFEVMDQSIQKLSEKSVIVVTSKIVSLCEGRVVPVKGTNKEELIKREAEFFLPSTLSKYGHHFTITRHSLIAVSGIDESNGGGDYYVLWPANPQESANRIRAYLRDKFSRHDLGVIISDSTCLPLRWGTIGLPIAYSGFEPTKDYIGRPDLFGRPFKVSRSGVALGLTAAAVVTMGEGAEQTPMAIIENAPFVKFQDHDPTDDELEQFYIAGKDEDLFAPFLNAVDWRKGGQDI
jgi:F420-0:gamma-glutamyl ligase